jgi:DNA-binding phage protein
MGKAKGALDLSEQLREAIRASGQSLNQIGKASGVGSDQLSRFMRAERDLTLTTAGRLFETLGLRLVSEPAQQQTEKPSKTKRPAK